MAWTYLYKELEWREWKTDDGFRELSDVEIFPKTKITFQGMKDDDVENLEFFSWWNWT